MLQSTFYCIYLCEYLSDLEEWTPESGISKCMNILFTVHTQILLITSIMCTVTTPSHPPWRSSQDSLFFYLFIYFLKPPLSVAQIGRILLISPQIPHFYPLSFALLNPQGTFEIFCCIFQFYNIHLVLFNNFYIMTEIFYFFISFQEGL